MRKYQVNIKEIPIFEKVSMKFFFKLPKDMNNPVIDSLIFCKKDMIFSLNFITQQPNIMYEFKKALAKQPYYFRMNKN